MRAESFRQFHCEAVCNAFCVKSAFGTTMQKELVLCVYLVLICLTAEIARVLFLKVRNAFQRSSINRKISPIHLPVGAFPARFSGKINKCIASFRDDR